MISGSKSIVTGFPLIPMGVVGAGSPPALRDGRTTAAGFMNSKAGLGSPYSDETIALTQRALEADTGMGRVFTGPARLFAADAVIAIGLAVGGGKKALALTSAADDTGAPPMMGLIARLIDACEGGSREARQRIVALAAVDYETAELIKGLAGHKEWANLAMTELEWIISHKATAVMYSILSGLVASEADAFVSEFVPDRARKALNDSRAAGTLYYLAYSDPALLVRQIIPVLIEAAKAHPDSIVYLFNAAYVLATEFEEGDLAGIGEVAKVSPRGGAVLRVIAVKHSELESSSARALITAACESEIAAKELRKLAKDMPECFTPDHALIILAAAAKFRPAAVAVSNLRRLNASVFGSSHIPAVRALKLRYPELHFGDLNTFHSVKKRPKYFLPQPL